MIHSDTFCINLYSTYYKECRFETIKLTYLL